MDKFRIEVIKATPNPQQVMWLAMHQDYAEEFVWDQRDRAPDETKAGENVIKFLLAGERGHYGPLEHPQITFNVGFFPHSMMQQIRTHRVGLCLSGDTKVYFSHPTQSDGEVYYESTIEHLANLWHRGRKHQQTLADADYMKKQISSRSILVLDIKTNRFVKSRITNIYENSFKKLYRIESERGDEIKASEDHWFWTNQGWLQVKNFNENTKLCSPERLGQNIVSQQVELKADNVKNNTVSCKRGVFFGIKQIEPMKVAQLTYDIEVEHEDHNFLANNFVVHNSFDVQSFRYTGKRILDVAEGKRDVEDVFYLRPVGEYTNRQGKRYFYSEQQRQADLEWCLEASKRYQQSIAEGLAEEHARGIIPFDTRQHFVMSCNARSLMHLLDLRWKKDAQLEAQKFSELLFGHFQQWTPQLAQWYLETRAKKAKLSP